jgi:transposase
VTGGRRLGHWGLEHRDLEGIRAIGVDEVLWHIGHKYLTVVYQIDAHGCRLWIGRTEPRSALRASSTGSVSELGG